MQKFIFGSLLLTGFNAQLHAQETVQNLPDLVVTATRTETAKNQLAAAATEKLPVCSCAEPIPKFKEVVSG